jgi:hypothetical protein
MVIMDRSSKIDYNSLKKLIKEINDTVGIDDNLKGFLTEAIKKEYEFRESERPRVAAWYEDQIKELSDN